ncbi:MAG: hypothetical protein KGJ62_03180 [Armatimonadetes bacterium]|nr:hypothetical protein [Armatimonadota bacterium]MDE2207203.1 hypothetical protein [Armatimonadota bacterium]
MKAGALRGAAVAALFAAAAPARAVAPPTYAHDILPILRSRCIVCHSATNVGSAAISGGLALDSYAAVRNGVHGEPILKPGASGASVIIKRLTAISPSLLMPRGGPPLSKARIALFRRWIDAGAPEGSVTASGTVPATVPAAMPSPADVAIVSVPTQLAGPVQPGTPPRRAAVSLSLKVGPLSPVTALAINPSGKLLAVGVWRAVEVWNLDTGSVATPITMMPGQVESLAWNSAGTALAVAGGTTARSGQVTVFDTTSWRQLGPTLAGDTDICTSVAFSPDGATIGAGSHDKTARLWAWPSGRLIKVLNDASDAVTRVAFSPHGKWFYTAGWDRTVRRYRMPAGTLAMSYAGSQDAIHALAIDPNGTSLVSGSRADLHWWQVTSPASNDRRYGMSASVTDLSFSSKGDLLVSCSQDGAVRLWNGNSRNGLANLASGLNWLYAAAVSPNGAWAAAGGEDGVVTLINLKRRAVALSLACWPAPATGVAQWLAATPQGWYDASAGWRRDVHLTVGATTVIPEASLCSPSAIHTAFSGAPVPTAPPLPQP